MWNKPSPEQLTALPGIYETEGVELRDKIVRMHFFIAGFDWYAVEYDPEDQLFWGYVNLNDPEMAEWGYFNLVELEGLRTGLGIEVDCDLYWTPKPASEVIVSRAAV